MGEAIKHHEFYQQGYSDGYKEGFSKALEHYTNQIMNRPMQIIISKDDLTRKVCKGKCYLYNTEHCRPDELALDDATTCKSYHTEESFNAMKKLL
jgi:CMP-N-acetylneuraminic acid synthetase